MREFFLSKRFWIGVLIVFCSIIFHAVIENALNDFLVKHVLRYVEKSFVNDLIFISFVFFIVRYTLVKFKTHFIPSSRVELTLIVVTLFYSYYRFGDIVWDFTPFWTYEPLKYSDILFVLLISHSFLFIKLYIPKAKKIQNTTKTLGIDKPIGDYEDDLLGYENYANSLASRIDGTTLDIAFAIGVNGKWGYGKTSFIKLTLKKLKDNNTININFNPWSSESPKAIIRDFFEILQERIHPYHSSIGRDLSIYSKKLASTDETQLIKSIINLFYEDGSINELYTRINEKIGKIKKKIIIVIDDLDRLDKEEIIEVVRLIRNTANFQNTVFIVGYDRDYVINALRHLSDYREEYFLEKIFQLEIHLPMYNALIIKDELKIRLKNLLIGFDNQIIERIFDKGLPNVIFEKWICNFRDLTRLVNGISLNFRQLLLEGEVELYDVLFLEILRLKQAKAYNVFFKNFSVFSNRLSQIISKEYYQSYHMGKPKDNPSDTNEKILINILEKELITKSDIDNIIILLHTILKNGKKINEQYYSQRQLSIVNPNMLVRYSSYSLLDSEISFNEFDEACNSDEKVFHKKIENWIERGLEREIESKFTFIIYFESKDHFEKVIKGIFHFARQKSNLKLQNNDINIIEYSYSDLSKKLKNSVGEKSFTRNILLNPPYPYLFESNFLYNLKLNRTSLDNILSAEDIQKYIESYFVKFLAESVSFNQDIFIELYNNVRFYMKQEDEARTLNKLSSLTLEFATKRDLNGFLKMFLKENNGRGKEGWLLDDTFKWFWVEIEDFESFVFSQDEQEWSYLEEFKDFYNTWKKASYEPIEYHFKIIPVNKRLTEYRGDSHFNFGEE